MTNIVSDEDMAILGLVKQMSDEIWNNAVDRLEAHRELEQIDDESLSEALHFQHIENHRIAYTTDYFVDNDECLEEFGSIEKFLDLLKSGDSDTVKWIRKYHSSEKKDEWTIREGAVDPHEWKIFE